MSKLEDRSNRQARKDSAFELTADALETDETHQPSDSRNLLAPSQADVNGGSPASISPRYSLLPPRARSSTPKGKDIDIGLVKTHATCLPQRMNFMPLRHDNFVFHFPLPPSTTAATAIQQIPRTDQGSCLSWNEFLNETMSNISNHSNIIPSLHSNIIPSVKHKYNISTAPPNAPDKYLSKALPALPKPFKPTPKDTKTLDQIKHNRQKTLQRLERAHLKQRPETLDVPPSMHYRRHYLRDDEVKNRRRRRDTIEDVIGLRGEELSDRTVLFGQTRAVRRGKDHGRKARMEREGGLQCNSSSAGSSRSPTASDGSGKTITRSAVEFGIGRRNEVDAKVQLRMDAFYEEEDSS